MTTTGTIETPVAAEAVPPTEEAAPADPLVAQATREIDEEIERARAWFLAERVAQKEAEAKSAQRSVEKEKQRVARVKKLIAGADRQKKAAVRVEATFEAFLKEFRAAYALMTKNYHLALAADEYNADLFRPNDGAISRVIAWHFISRVPMQHSDFPRMVDTDGRRQFSVGDILSPPVLTVSTEPEAEPEPVPESSIFRKVPAPTADELRGSRDERREVIRAAIAANAPRPSADELSKLPPDVRHEVLIDWDALETEHLARDPGNRRFTQREREEAERKPQPSRHINVNDPATDTSSYAAEVERPKPSSSKPEVIRTATGERIAVDDGWHEVQV